MVRACVDIDKCSECFKKLIKHVNRIIITYLLPLQENSEGMMNGLHYNGQDSFVQPLLTDLYQVGGRESGSLA